MGLRQGTAENGEVLAEDEHQTAIDHAVAGDDTVAGNLVVLHAEIRTAVLDKHVPFFESALVQQHLQALTGCELALGMLGINALLPAAQPRRSALFFQLFQDVVHGQSS